MTQRLVLKGKQILEQSQEANPHRLALKTRISYPTIEKYINRPESVQAYDATVIPMLYLDGIEMDPETFLNLRIGDVFELVKVDD